MKASHNRAKAVTMTMAMAFALWCTGSGVANAALLTNGSGDGQLSVNVGATGGFGSNSGDAFYNPVGPGTRATTTFQSFVAFRSGGTGARTNLSNVAGSFLTTSDLATTSQFSFGGLTFGLTQSLTPLLSGASQVGTQLSQVYSFTNTTASALDFELVRYLDGDLYFDGSFQDGGGRFFSGGTEFLGLTDKATGASDATTLVAITGEGGTTPSTNRYEISPWNSMLSRISNGGALNNSVINDGADLDQFIDAGKSYDVTLGLRNTYSLGAGASGTYMTRTIFGSGAPAQIGAVAAVPEPGTMSLMGLGLAALAAARRKKKAAQEEAEETEEI